MSGSSSQPLHSSSLLSKDAPTASPSSSQPLLTTPNGAPAAPSSPLSTSSSPHTTVTPPKAPSAAPSTDLELLAKLEEANRLLESDKRSLQVLSPRHQARTHSRQGSLSSLMSNASVNSNGEDLIAGTPEDLWNRWGKIVNDWEGFSKRKPSQIKELVRRGIPHHFRGLAWQLLCGAHTSPAKEQYAELLKLSSPSEKLIRRDITRTYPEHHFFKERNGLGQESLFNVMKAYSLVDREVGYCQGSAFIVGLLLMQMPEEEAFAVMVKVMQEYRLRELFKPSMAELGLCMFQLEWMIQENLPQLFGHFQAQSVCVSMFASSWFLTLFTTSLPLAVACRVFDVFLSEGIEIVFKVGFAILELHLSQLLAMDMEGILKILQKQIPFTLESDQDQLFNVAYQVKYNAKKMKKLEKEYNALKSKEQEEQVELRRLRTENRLLRQRIDNLEKETATLADRLIHDQVKYAQQTEEVYAMRRDIAQLNSTKHNGSSDSPHKRSNSTSSASSAEAPPGEVNEKVEKLSKQVADLKHHEQEAKACIRQLREKLRQVEHANRELQADPKDEIQSCQEELIACKLREAEANLSMKELQQKVVELERHYQRYVEKQAAVASGASKPSNKQQQHELKAAQDELMAVRLKEAQAVSELKEMKQKVMELETQNHISERHCKRLESEVCQLKEQLDEGDLRDKDLHAQIQELERKVSSSQEQKREDEMMTRLKSAEHAQAVAEMRQRIAELEIENQEVMTAGALRDKGSSEDLAQKVTELQEQVMQLKMARRLQSMSASMAMSTLSIGDTESDSDMEATVHKHALQLTESLSLTTGMTLDDLARTRTAANPESSDSESGDGAEKKTAVTRRKRRSHYSDADKTPTQDTVNTFSVVENGLKDINGRCPPRMSEEDEDTLSELESTCSHHTSLSSDTTSTSATTSSSGSSNVITASASKLHDIPEPVDL